ncbi:MAG: 30S ribosomal protein S2 [Candidatus Babeliales bacterium]
MKIIVKTSWELIMKDLQALMKAGVHFGHVKMRCCPKMKPYIWGVRNGIHLIDVSKTAVQMEKALTFLKTVIAEGKTILWVGTKKPARKAIQEAAMKLDMPYVCYRLIGGTISNFTQVKKSVTKLMHYQEMLEKIDDTFSYTKKELSLLRKLVEKLEKKVGGIKKLTWPIGAVVLVDVLKEASAIREARKMRVPVVALVDTNGDPTNIDYPIPGNDDLLRSIDCITSYLADGLKEEKDRLALIKKEEVAAEAQKAEDLSEPEETSAAYVDDEEDLDEKVVKAKKLGKGKIAISSKNKSKDDDDSDGEKNETGEAKKMRQRVVKKEAIKEKEGSHKRSSSLGQDKKDRNKRN